MTCTFPPPLRDEQLLTYIDGLASGEISTHIAGCAACQARADELARLQNRLSAGLFRVTCPSSLALGEYQAGLLAVDEARSIQQHLATCHHCTRELNELQGYLQSLPPVFAVDRWQQIKTQTRILVARLVDGLSSLGGGGLAPAPVGIRGEEAAQWVYEVDDVQVILEVQQDAEQLDRKVILGLILGLDTEQTGITANLWQNDKAVTTISVDELGNFIFANLLPGLYELIIKGADVEIHIYDLPV